VMIVKSLRNTI